MKRNLSVKPTGGRGWLLFLVLGLLACMVMGLVLVWSNIERMDTTYFINIAQNTMRERRALRAQLEVERERLLSPCECPAALRHFPWERQSLGGRRMECIVGSLLQIGS